jgi:hypothetical protein
MFRRDDPTGVEQSIAFKKAFSMDVEIEFMGVWYDSFSTWCMSLAPTVSRGTGIRLALLG